MIPYNPETAPVVKSGISKIEYEFVKQISGECMVTDALLVMQQSLIFIQANKIHDPTFDAKAHMMKKLQEQFGMARAGFILKTVNIFADAD